MIIATSEKSNYVTDIVDGEYQLKADGRGGNYQRPTHILASAYASCMNITVRKLLDKKNLCYDKVIVYVDFDNSHSEKTIFSYKIEILGDIDQTVKDEIIKSVNDCSVCKILKSQKEFISL